MSLIGENIHQIFRQYRQGPHVAYVLLTITNIARCS